MKDIWKEAFVIISVLLFCAMMFAYIYFMKQRDAEVENNLRKILSEESTSEGNKTRGNNVKAIGKYILVSAIKDDRVLEGVADWEKGIAIARGEVVAIGDKVFEGPDGDSLTIELWLDDIVLFNLANSIHVMIADKEHRIIKLEDIYLSAEDSDEED